MSISSPGIGSGLDVNGIVTKLMNVEAQPLQTLAKREAAYQAKIAAYGTLSGSLTSFQGSLSNLNSTAAFQKINASVSDSSIFSASATTSALAGAYSVSISQLAQAQTLQSGGVASMTTAIGSGTDSGTGTIQFKFGTINGGSFIKSGTTLPASVLTTGMPPGSLILNGSSIATGSSTNSAYSLATAINLKTSTTGVTATVSTTTATLGAFTDIATSVGDSYAMSVGGVSIASLSASSVLNVATLDADLSDTSTVGAAGTLLAAAGITKSGTAAAGTLTFTRADGANIAITQTLTNASTTATGGFASLTSGVTQTTTGLVSLSSDTGIVVSGTTPTLAGLTAGSGVYTNAGFTQDTSQTSGTVTIDSTNNSLQGIRDAINKAGLGVTASIISDGSATPYHLVMTSNKTGASYSIKTTVTGASSLQSMFAFDPADVAGQMMTQSSAAQNTLLSVNGIAVSSASNTISEAVQGVTLTASKVGTATINVSRNTSSISGTVSSFVKAYNDLNTSIKSLTGYDSATKSGGPLLGDGTARIVQTDIRRMMTSAIPELSSNTVKSLSDVGVTFQKDGSLAFDSTKLQTALSTYPDQVASMFASIGVSTDSLVSVVSSTSSTKSGTYAVNITSHATQGSITGTTALGATTISANTTLSVILDGTTATVPLVAGTYSTPAAFASMLQTAINGVSTFSANSSAVTATVDSSSHLKITSNRYGSASKITIAAGTGTTPAAIYLTSPVGADVVGSIGGLAATGSGQNLTAATGSAVAGLKLLIPENASLSSSMVFSQGYAYQLNNLIAGYVASTGLLPGKTAGINASITSIGKTRDALSIKLTATEARLRKQYTALDTAMSKMSSTSTYLTQQLASLSNLNK